MDEKKKKKGEDEGLEEDVVIETDRDVDDFELEHDDAEPDDRRRDPLRRP